MCRAGDGPAETPDPATGTPQSLAPSPGALGSHMGEGGFVQHNTAGALLSPWGRGSIFGPEARQHNSSRP